MFRLIQDERVSCSVPTVKWSMTTTTRCHTANQSWSTSLVTSSQFNQSPEDCVLWTILTTSGTAMKWGQMKRPKPFGVEQNPTWQTTDTKYYYLAANWTRIGAIKSVKQQTVASAEIALLWLDNINSGSRWHFQYKTEAMATIT